VTLHLIYSTCILILLYGLGACKLTKSDLSYLDFVLNRFMMKLFKTANIAIVDYCRSNFGLDLPSVLWCKPVGCRLRTFQRAKYKSHTLPLNALKGGSETLLRRFTNKTDILSTKLCYNVSLCHSVQIKRLHCPRCPYRVDQNAIF